MVTSKVQQLDISEFEDALREKIRAAGGANEYLTNNVYVHANKDEWLASEFPEADPAVSSTVVAEVEEY